MTIRSILTAPNKILRQISETIKKVVEYKGQINFDSAQPDGNPRKLIDSSHLNNFEWKMKTVLKEGLTKTYKSFLKF